MNLLIRLKDPKRPSLLPGRTSAPRAFAIAFASAKDYNFESWQKELTNLKTLFIHCNINSLTLPHYVPGLGSLSAFLKQAGHETALIFLQEDLPREDFLARVREIAPDLVGFSTLTNQWRSIRQYTRWLREAFPFPIIHGGTHVTVDPETVIACPEVDLICIGEGEWPLRELVERLEKSAPYDDIPNLWLKKTDGRIIKNPLRPLMENLDSLPFPDRALFDYPRLLQENPRNATLLMAGRGCPFTCNYCVNNRLHKLYRGLGHYVRLRSPENVLAEIKGLIRDYGLDSLWIYDDTFTYDHGWLEKFCERYGREIGIPFMVNVRLDTVNEKLLTLLKQAGCEMIVAGIESGNPRVREKVLGRKMTNEKIIAGYAAAKKLGLKTWAYYIFGIPTETPAEAEDTLRLHDLVQPDVAQVSVFYPYPGTQLYEFCEKNGYLTDREHPNFFQSYDVVRHPTFTPEQIAGYIQRLNDLHLWHRLLRDKRGDFDFLFHFPAARVQASGSDYLKLTAALINGKEHFVLFAHPESRVSYALSLPEPGLLRFGIGLYPESWSPDKGTGVHFEIQLEVAGKIQTIFSHDLDPKNHLSDRKLHDFELPLPALPTPATLHWTTTTQGRSNEYCWSFWAHPSWVGVPALYPKTLRPALP